MLRTLSTNSLTSLSYIGGTPQPSSGGYNNVFFEQEKIEEDNQTEFLILDFSAVLGIDATSARSCFLMVCITYYMLYILYGTTLQAIDISLLALYAPTSFPFILNNILSYLQLLFCKGFFLFY